MALWAAFLIFAIGWLGLSRRHAGEMRIDFSSDQGEPMAVVSKRDAPYKSAFAFVDSAKSAVSRWTGRACEDICNRREARCLQLDPEIRPDCSLGKRQCDDECRGQKRLGAED